jgi:nitrogen fixation protein NifB
VTSAVLAPKQALYYLEASMRELGPVEVVGIAGPGDAFAEPDFALETFELVHTHFPELTLCVATNGLNAAPYAKQLAGLGVHHVSVTVNAVDPAIGAEIVAWVRYNRKTYRGVEGASLLWERQQDAIRTLHENGITVKVNCIVIPGVNDGHIGEIARNVAECGANVINPIAFIPVEGSDMAGREQPDHDCIQKARWEASRHLSMVRHCTRCRADAAGLLGDANTPTIDELLRKTAAGPLDPADHRPYVAVASREGVLVNEHLGKTDFFFIYGRKDGLLRRIDKRPAPREGQGLERWRNVAKALHDCRTLIVNQAGEPPIATLYSEGIKVIVTEGLVEEAVTAIFAGRACASRTAKLSCEGSNGNGCG